MNIFVDLDGTLLDSRQRLHRLFCDLAPDLLPDLEQYWTYKRTPRSHAWILGTLHGWSPDRIAAFEQDWLDRIETPAYLALDRPFSHTDRALDALAQHGSLFLLTARRFPDELTGQLGGLGLARHFTAVLPTGPGRSKAETVRAQDIAIVASDIIVGDTGDDIETARELGVVSVALSCGFRCSDYLANRGADFVYGDLMDFATRHFASRIDRDAPLSSGLRP